MSTANHTLAARPLFLFVTAAGSLRVVPELLERLRSDGYRVYAVATPNAAHVLPLDELFAELGDDWIRDYGQPPLERFPFGTMLVAPCTFNTFTKIALGLADNLATAMIGDAVGAGCPTLIVPGMAPGQWAHPMRALYAQRLAGWGVQLAEPTLSPATDTAPPRLQLAGVNEIAMQLARL